MAPLPRNSIDHFTHPGHKLAPFDSDTEFLCDGCITQGAGKRYRCNHGCDFDLHEYCATCPRSLSSFMHPNHPLTLVIRKAQGARQVDRICDVCSEPVEGLFYRCKGCEFDVHPLCTQLPQRLQHALHKAHPMSLESSSVVSFCAVCRGACGGWRYRCGGCGFDIHLECVLVPVVHCTGKADTSGGSKHRGIPQGIPFQPPPQFAAYYGYYGFNPYGPGHGYSPYGPGHGFNMHHNGGQYMYPNNLNQQVGVNSTSGTSTGGSGKPKKSMFALVGQLGFGVLSNMIFGMDFVSLFAG